MAASSLQSDSLNEVKIGGLFHLYAFYTNMHADLRLRPMTLQLEKLGSWNFFEILEEFFFWHAEEDIMVALYIFILLFSVFNY